MWSACPLDFISPADVRASVWLLLMGVQHFSDLCSFTDFTCRVGDCFYVDPDTFNQIEEVDAVKPEVPAYVAKSRFHKGGANAGLRAFGVAKLLGLKKTQGQVGYSPDLVPT